MSATYRAIEVPRPGEFSEVRKPLLDPLGVNSGSLVFGMRSISGSTTGSVQDEQETVEFSLLENVEPMIEVMPLSKAREAYDRMMAAKARFRVVLSMNRSSASN